MLLLLHQVIDTIESYPAIVADNTATAVGIRQTSDDLIMTGLAHFRSICVKYALIVGLVIFGEDLVQLRIGGIAISLAGFLRHLDAAEGHERTLQGLIGLQADDLLQILAFFADIARGMGSQGRNDVGVHIQYTALGAFFLLQLLQNPPELIGRFGRTCQEGLIAIIGLVVFLDEIPYIDFFLPQSALKTIPLFELCHLVSSCMYQNPAGIPVWETGPSERFSVRISPAGLLPKVENRPDLSIRIFSLKYNPQTIQTQYTMPFKSCI